MRHKKSFNHLGRTASHRKAMLSNMAVSLIMHKRITTTLAKAKESHDQLEKFYVEAMDFEEYNKNAAKIIGKVFK